MRAVAVEYLSTADAERLKLWGTVDEETGDEIAGACPTCGRELAEEPRPGGAMFICFPRAVFGEQPPADAEVPPFHRWYVWLD